MKRIAISSLAACVAFAAFAAAQAQQAPAAMSTTPAAATVVAPPPCCVVPAGTEIELEIAEPVDSATRKRGDKFAIALHMPVYAGQTLLLPAGTSGVGEVVEAQPSGGGGKPGELILAARYLEVGDRRIPLRAMKISSVGADKSQKAMALSMAVGMFAQLVHGGEVQIPKGALATAKLAEALSADAPVNPQPASAQAANASTTTVSKE